MKKKMMALLGIAMIVSAMAAGCGSSSTAESTAAETEAVSIAETDSAETAAEEETAETTAVSDSAGETAGAAVSAEVPEDGVYSASFDAHSNMFHLNETCDERGTLTVKDGEMTIHITLVSQNITALYSGKAEAAEQDEEHWLLPTLDEVTYSDGMTEEVNGFDLPVPALNTDFDVALLGSKGKWYDHTVVISDVQPLDQE